MRYASVCSGVESTTLAWRHLGWEPVWFSEIEPFPCAVLKERFPSVPNLGDMTKIRCVDSLKGEFEYADSNGSIRRRVFGRIDMLVGGTPCQSWSTAGKREGLRGISGLALVYVELLKAMQPRWFVWENVPGVFSANGGEDFKTILRTWDKIGYSLAWRVLDAQYVRVDGFPRAVPQRRRRVFVVGHLGTDWRYPAEVLFEPACMRGNTPPRRVKGKGFAAGVERGALGAGRGNSPSQGRHCCGNGTREDGARTTMSMHSSQDPIVGIEVSNAVNTNNGLENCVYAAFLGGQGAKAGGIAYSKDASPTLKATSSGSNMVPNIVVSDVCGTLCASDGKGKNGQDAYDGKLIVEKDDHSGVNGFNFEMWTGEAKDISPTLQRKRTSDTLLYRDQCNEKKTPNTPKELEK